MTNDNDNTRTNADDDLQRVRDILFGAEQQRQNDRLAHMEEQFQTQLDALRKSVKDELEDTRRDLEQKIQALRDGKIEKDDLADMFGGIVQRLGSAAKQLGG